MLAVELIIALFASGIATLGTLLIYLRFKSSPVIESRFFILGAVSFTVYYYSVIPVTYLNDPSSQLFFLKLAPIFGNFGLFILSLSILLPTISTSYKNVFFLLLLTMLVTAASIINFQTITFTVSSYNYIVISYQTPISFLLLIMNGLAYVFVLILRIRNVNKLVHKNMLDADRYVLKFQFYFIYLILIAITLGSLVLNRTLEQGTVPGFLWFFPMSLDFFYLGYAIYRDESFLFLTASKLEGILISENRNGLVVYSKNYSLETDDLFANLLNAVNISLKTNIQSKKNIEQIIFGDKIILSVYGELVTTFLIVTQTNLVIQSIARYVTVKFEKKYRTPLIQFGETGIVTPKSIQNFDDEIDYIRAFIPL